MKPKVQLRIRQCFCEEDGSYRIDGEKNKTFNTMEEADAFLDEEFKNAAREKLYGKGENGERCHIGYGFKFTDSAEYHLVEYRELRPIVLGVEGMFD